MVVQFYPGCVEVKAVGSGSTEKRCRYHQTAASIYGQVGYGFVEASQRLFVEQVGCPHFVFQSGNKSSGTSKFGTSNFSIGSGSV